MNCVFCNRPYSPGVGCCDTAAINAAIQNGGRLSFKE